jgi:Xaa-Pro aminopeptidase
VNNISRVQNALAGADIDAMLITGAHNRRYASGFPGTAGAMLISRRCACFFTDSRYLEAARAAVRSAQVCLVDRENTYAKQIEELCAEFGIETLGFEDGDMPYAEYLSWSEKLSARLVPASAMLSSLRAAKSEEEIAGMIAAQRVAEQAFLETLPLIRRGAAERDIAAELVCRMLKNGAEDKAFDPIVFSGVRSSQPHGAPTAAKIERGLVTLDFGALVNGWCSDTTRTVCVGEPTEEERRVYAAVLEAQLAGIAAVRAGVTCSAPHFAAAEVLARYGYGEYFVHGFGHGLGLEVHEAPTISPGGEGTLTMGAVISAEPGVYLPGRFGVRIEDVLIVRASGSENITKLPKELLILE